MKNDFVAAFNMLLEDKQLPRDVIMEALEAAMISAYRKTVNASNAQHVVAKIDQETGKVSIFAEKEVVELVQDPRTEVSLEDAHEVEPESEFGSMVVVESTPKDFGRVAAQTARQVIQQRIREAERSAQHEYFNKMIGEIVTGIVQAVNPHMITLGLDRKAEGIMPRNHQIPGERFRVHDRVRALLLDIKQGSRGPQITLSRAHQKFLRRLLEDEVPEIYQGMVEIRSIAREPGHRSKVAVSALQPGIDPVGACVGIRGVRIQAIVRELNDEKIDVIEWNADPSVFIAKALSPARVTGVYLEDSTQGKKTATVVVPEDQLSLAIGRDGQNARLSAKLTGWRIDIKSLPEATSDALFKLQNDPDFAPELEELEGQIPQIEAVIQKKTEGRPVTPEEYQVLNQFVDHVERGVISRREAELEVQRARRAEARATISEAAFSIPLDELSLSPRMTIKLSGEGFTSVGDLLYQMELDPGVILGISGIGPKTMEAIESALAEVEIPEIPVEEEIEPAPEEIEEPEVEDVAVPTEDIEAVEEIDEAEEEVSEEPVAELIAEEEAVEVTEADEPQVVEPVVAEAAVEEAEPEPQSLEEIFTLKEDEFVIPDAITESETEDIQPELDPQKKKKKKRFVELEYDPDRDVTIVRRRRKKSDEEWEEDWEE